MSREVFLPYDCECGYSRDPYGGEATILMMCSTHRAAPDLLAALEVGERFMAAWLADHSMDEWPLGKYEAIEIARTAIAKAKGT